MINLTVQKVRPFLRAKNFLISKEFYKSLGCVLKYDSEKLSLFELGNSQFYLQDDYVKEYAENSMILFSVEDVESWHQHIIQVLADFTEFDDDCPRLLSPPKDEAPPYNARVCYLVDPSGILIHIAQYMD